MRQQAFKQPWNQLENRIKVSQPFIWLSDKAEANRLNLARRKCCEMRTTRLWTM